MLRLETTSRRALFLYGTLLVLPTLIFGWLYWSELQKDFEREREQIPEKASAKARGILSGMSERLMRLVDNEAKRPFTQYAELVSAEDANGGELALPTQLTKLEMPVGILGWFSFGRSLRPDSEIQVFVGQGIPDREGMKRNLLSVVQDFRRRKPPPEVAPQHSSEASPVNATLSAVAVSICGEDELDCVRNALPALRDRNLAVSISGFTLWFFRDADDNPRALASRRVLNTQALRREELPADAPCLEPMLSGINLQQGFVIDVQWLFKDLPWDIGKITLDEDEELRAAPEGVPIDKVGSVFASISPVRDLAFDTFHAEDENYGRLEIVIDSERFEERVARQSQRFLTTGFMLLLTLGIGMTLLYRSVRRELDQAHRMQNFVAAVTHELRTPISTIRLHAEMLQDGWVTSEKQPEYYARIVRETHRLSTLVERVLEKSRLKENVTRPVAGDLNEHVTAQQDDLMPPQGEPSDLAFQLEPKLPKVWLTAEGVGMIVSNLVENARKYAPAKGEPILVRTRWSNGRVLLEVLDRGPGVPPSEREKIFEAFYRIGREETRTTTGTGLGLHLVRLHAETCQARATVEDREGGGSAFRVSFRPAD